MLDYDVWAWADFVSGGHGITILISHSQDFSIGRELVAREFRCESFQLQTPESPALTCFFTNRYTTQNPVKITRYRRRTCAPRSVFVCATQRK